MIGDGTRSALKLAPGVKPSRLARPKRRGPSAGVRLKKQPIPDAEYMRSDPCAHCGGPSSQWDHIDPVYRGGTHTADNLTRACWRCNRTKNTQKLILFLARRAAA